MEGPEHPGEIVLTVGSLFAGIGGFDRGFTRAGFEIRWQVELNPFCRAVLARQLARCGNLREVRRRWIRGVLLAVTLVGLGITTFEKLQALWSQHGDDGR